jgi:uncharacterized protein YegL
LKAFVKLPTPLGAIELIAWMTAPVSSVRVSKTFVFDEDNVVPSPVESKATRLSGFPERIESFF